MEHKQIRTIELDVSWRQIPRRFFFCFDSLILMNTVSINAVLKETRRSFRQSQDGSRTLERATELPAVDKGLVAFCRVEFLSPQTSLERLQMVLCRLGLTDNGPRERYFASLLGRIAHAQAKKADRTGDTVYMEVEFRVFTDLVRPKEMCMLCMVEFTPQDDVVTSVCGIDYHRDCLRTYKKSNVGCPKCNYGITRSFFGLEDEDCVEKIHVSLSEETIRRSTLTGNEDDAK